MSLTVSWTSRYRTRCATARRYAVGVNASARQYSGASSTERPFWKDFCWAIAGRLNLVWNDVAVYIQQRQPKGYDQAIRLLIDLRDLAIGQGHEAEFRAKIEHLRVKHAAKPSFIERLIKADF
jgi:hypothetical protein